MTSTNSSNDRLVLRQNVVINSNEYFSCDVIFREWNRPPRGLETSLRNHQEICLLSSELFQQFIMVYRTIIGENFHLFIICYDWWCHFPFLKKISVIAEALFSCDQAAIRLVQSVRPSVRLSVRLSVCHTFFTMFLSSYHHEIFRSYYHGQKWCPCKRSRSEVKGQGHRGRHPT